MPRFTHNQYVALVLGIVVVGLCVGYWFALQHIDQLVAERGTLNEEQAAGRVLKEQAAAVRQLTNETLDERAELSTYLVSFDDPTPLLDLLEDTATTQGIALEVENLRSGEWTNEAGVTVPVVHAALSVHGSWDALYQYVIVIEHAPYALLVDRVALEYQEDAQEGGAWNGQVHITVGAHE